MMMTDEVFKLSAHIQTNASKLIGLKNIVKATDKAKKWMKTKSVTWAESKWTAFHTLVTSR